MGDKIEARGRDAENEAATSSPPRPASCARRATTRPASASCSRSSQRGMDVYAKSVKIVPRRRRDDPRVRASSRSKFPTTARACRRCWCIPIRDVAGGKPAPAMVFFDGFDVTKEIQYCNGVPDLAARGIGCLIVDGPGNGESVRFRNLPLIAETEHYAHAGLRISRRPRREFDPKRIGVMAISLGGYYAPRAASLEPRYACCIAWGAQWDYHAIWKQRLETARLRQGAVAVGAAGASAMGARRRQPRRGAEEARRLPARRHRAEDAAARSCCCTARATSRFRWRSRRNASPRSARSRRRCKVFTREEGGFHHCQVDNVTIGVHSMWDWVADVLKPGTVIECRPESHDGLSTSWPGLSQAIHTVLVHAVNERRGCPGQARA